MGRVRIGEISVDAVSFDGALNKIDAMVMGRRGGNVFTPNVDHIVQAGTDERFRTAYASANLCLADGMPLVWASKLLGTPIPERVAGSDLFEPLMRRAAQRGWRVYLLGSESSTPLAARKLRTMGVNVVGFDTPWIVDPTDADARAEVMRRIRKAGTELLIVCFGAPKQEVWMHHAREELGSIVALGLGGTLDFFIGKTKRAPRWMSKAGLEWLHRLVSEPSRMWRRYLLRDPAFAGIVLRALLNRTPRLPSGIRRGPPASLPAPAR